MTKQYPLCGCSREIMEEGAKNRIEVALDRNSEAAVLIELEAYLAHPKRKTQQKAVNLVDLLEKFCNRPLDLRKEEFKYLRQDIWELKLGTMRMLLSVHICTFATGRNSLTFPSRVMAAPPGCNTARATSIFEKNGKETPHGEIQKAIGITSQDRTK